MCNGIQSCPYNGVCVCVQLEPELSLQRGSGESWIQMLALHRRGSWIQGLALQPCLQCSLALFPLAAVL